MTIFEKLRKEHEGLRRLLAQITKTQQLERRESLFRRLVEDWEEHALFEEISLYEFLGRSRVENEVASGQEEHGHLRQSIRKLSDMGCSDPHWLGEFEPFKATLLSHMRNEERSFFHHAGVLLSDSDKVDLLKAHRILGQQEETTDFLGEQDDLH